MRMFKGTDTEYHALHVWVEKQLGKPKKCNWCLEDDPERYYDWANMSGHYLKDIKDWERLCRSCHKRFDLHGDKDICKEGHKLTADNTYTYPNKTFKECRKCRRQSRADSKKRKLETNECIHCSQPRVTTLMCEPHYKRQLAYNTKSRNKLKLTPNREEQ